jgi:hypothetical protein
LKLRSFLGLIVLVGIVAVMYSPSTIRVTEGGFNTSPTSTGGSSTSLFVTYIKNSGYRVVLLNDSSQLRQIQGGTYVLIGPDKELSEDDITFIKNLFNSGKLSLLIAEGNTTNNRMLKEIFGATVSGAAVIVPGSPFVDKRVYIANFNLGNSILSGVIDISSYIITPNGVLRPVYMTPQNSYDTFDSRQYPRIVVAVTQQANSRALIIADSGPFINSIINTTIIDEKSFALSLLGWVAEGNKSTVIYYDNYHYVSRAPKYSFGLPVGPVFDYALSIAISNLNSYYQQLPLTIQNVSHLSYFDSSLIAGAVILLSGYALVRRVIQKEKVERDDTEPPQIEVNVLSLSDLRMNFDELVKKGSFYVATAERLYQILDDFSQKYLQLKFEEIPTRLNDASIARDRRILKFVRELKNIHDYAVGKKRLIFPPVLNWKKKIQFLDLEAEEFLTKIGAKTSSIYIDRTVAGKRNDISR